MFFNLCDGAWDEATPGIEIVLALERLDVPFTGSTSAFYEPSREAMKRACREWGVDTPAHVFATTDRDVERAADELTFPLFVKHPSSYASVGLTRESRVDDEPALRRQVRRMMRSFGGALVEEYVDGLECTVLVAENPDDPDSPLTYTPIRYEFPPGESFKHAGVKWVDYKGLSAFPVEDAALSARLRDAASKFFLGLDGAGYGRCDVRVDADGRPFMLEINANCGLYYPPADAGSADLCLSHDPAGHEGFTRTVVEAALRRHSRRRRSWEVRPGRSGRLAVHATRALARGERILSLDGPGHELVQAAVLEAAGEARRAWLLRHGFPLTDELWLCWSRDPESWAPVAHSCDPSAWLEGLTVVARRPIAAGEEVTLEHATYHDERTPAFRCDCAAELCRGTIRGDDYELALLREYGDHVSSHVRRKREGR